MRVSPPRRARRGAWLLQVRNFWKAERLSDVEAVRVGERERRSTRVALALLPIVLGVGFIAC
jgi:hypothetical protein